MGLERTLELSQEVWLSYADKQCSFVGWISRGGTGTSSRVAKCEYRLSLQRTKELKVAIEDIEEST